MKEIMLPWSFTEKKKNLNLSRSHSRLPYPLWGKNTNANLPFP